MTPWCVHGILQAKILEWVFYRDIPSTGNFYRDLPDPGIKPWSLALQADVLPSDPPKQHPSTWLNFKWASFYSSPWLPFSLSIYIRKPYIVNYFEGEAHGKPVPLLKQLGKLDTVFKNLAGKVRWLEFRQKSRDTSHERGEKWTIETIVGWIVFPLIYMLKPWLPILWLCLNIGPKEPIKVNWGHEGGPLIPQGCVLIERGCALSELCEGTKKEPSISWGKSTHQESSQWAP